MAKVQQKSEKITAFGGIFFVLDKFDSILSSVIDSHLGLRSTLIGYQYSEIIRAIFSVFCCGGDCMEDLNLYLKDVLTERPHTRVPSADTVLRGIEELATENISYTAEKTGNVYDFNTAEKLNQLLIKLLLATGQLTEGGAYDVDFDHQFLEADKYDSKRTYKGFDGYSPGVFTIGGLIAYLENRDGNPASCGFHLSYGLFDYIACGDLTSNPQNRVGYYVRDFIGEGHLDAFKCHHHLSANAWGTQMKEAYFNPRVIVNQNFYTKQPDATLVKDIMDSKNKFWVKDFFTTNLHPYYHIVNKEAVDKMNGYDGHIVIRVAPGGSQFNVYMLDDTNFEYKVKSVHGPYNSK